ncbi:MAG: response regulator [Cyclobacteriaceae bacterium]|nr:response regulator [Cyclobacteriaceae bacterium]
MKILVINRQEKVIGHIISVLASANVVAHQCTCGLEGLMAARAEQYDLIVAHTNLPVITGFEMIRSLRHSSVNKNTPVVFIADELSVKVKYLGSVLGAIATVTETDIAGLEEIVKNQLKKYEAKRASDWQELFQTQNLN